MKTSYYSGYKGDSGVSISRMTPANYINCPELIPSWELIRLAKNGHVDEYKKLYFEQLSRLNPQKIWDELHAVCDDEPVLLCWESPDKFCHRHLVAEWFEKELGVKVEEYVPEGHGEKVKLF